MLATAMDGPAVISGQAGSGPRSSISEVEKATGYVTRKKSGKSRRTLQFYRDNNLLLEGRRPTPEKPINEGPGYFKEWVTDYYKDAAIFYNPVKLAVVAKKQAAERVRKRWTVTETILKFGKKWVRDSYVWRKLGMSKHSFLSCKKRWNEEGNRWPILDEGKDRPETINENGHTYYSQTQVEDEMKRNLVALPPKIPENHPTLYSLDAAAALCPFGRAKLANSKFRKRHNLETKVFYTRGDTKRRGKTVPTLIPVIGLTRVSFDRFRKTIDLCGLPIGVISLQEVTRQLRNASAKCVITGNTLRKWCEEGLLDAMLSEYLTKTGLRKGWILSTESRDAARDVLRAAGWDAEAAKIELRRRRDAANAEKLVESRINAHREKVVEKYRKENAEQLVRKQQQRDKSPEPPVVTAPPPEPTPTEITLALLMDETKSSVDKQAAIVLAALGIEVDFEKQIIRKAARTPLNLGKSKVQWHIFIVAWAVFPNVPTMQQMRRRYPGVDDSVARNMSTSLLNEGLADLGVCIQAR